VTRPRAGRRPGSPDTRGDIVEAARAEFAERGYDAATVRAIAARAGVDPALVHHYFGAKEHVFLAAMQLPIEPATIVAAITTGPRDAIGERAVRTLLAVWENPAARTGFLALLRSAMTHEQAASLLRQFVTRTLLARVAATLDVPDPQLRAALCGSQLVGLAMLRFVLRVEPLASAPPESVVRLVGPTIQRYLTDPDPQG
jgi:AcrR family transcriptional regulator